MRLLQGGGFRLLQDGGRRLLQGETGVSPPEPGPFPTGDTYLERSSLSYVEHSRATMVETSTDTFREA